MNNFSETKIFKNVTKQKVCYFVSPHLDDAVFSAGGLIYDLNKIGIKTKVLNIFTVSGKPPYTISTRKFLNSCGYKDAEELFKERIIEDKKVMNFLKTEQINLGFTDALWRKKKNKNKFGNIIPELNHVYPFFRTSIAKGVISNHDQSLTNNIQKSLSAIIKKNDFVFCPAGIGNHTDHIITRDICMKTFPNLILWSDHPYDTKGNIDSVLVEKNRLLEYNHKVNIKAKTQLINMYKSQVKAIFGVDNVQAINEEKYWTAYENT